MPATPAEQYLWYKELVGNLRAAFKPFLQDYLAFQSAIHAEAYSESFLELINVGTFLLLYQSDELILLEDILETSDLEKQDLSLRVLSVCIYEFLENGASLWNTSLGRQIGRAWPDSPQLAAFRDSARALNDLRKQHTKLLHGIRNNVIAHRSKDSITQIDTLKSTWANKLEIVHLSVHVNEHQFALTSLYHELRNHLMVIQVRKMIKEQVGNVSDETLDKVRELIGDVDDPEVRELLRDLPLRNGGPST